MRILLADPDADVRRAVRRALASVARDVAFAEAEDRAGALARLGEGADLVVLEPLLPDGSGLDVLRAAVERRPPVPVLVLSDLDRDIDRFWALRLGAHAFLRKPVDPEVLADRAAKALRGAPRLTPERV